MICMYNVYEKQDVFVKKKKQVRDRLWMINGEYCDQLRIYDLKQLVNSPPQEFAGKKKSQKFST